MRLMSILTEDRVVLTHALASKGAALDCVAELLAKGSARHDAATVRTVIEEREALQSTGIGDGVAIPHGFLSDLTEQVAALVLVRDGVDFDAIDGKPARIILGVLGPKQRQLEHLRILARVSKILREPNLRERLQHAGDAASAYALVSAADARIP